MTSIPSPLLPLRGEDTIRNFSTLLDKLVRDNPELIRSLSDPDDFRAVIIGQTYIGALLTLILEYHFTDPTKRLPGMSFDTKLALALAFGDVNPAWVPILKKLAEMRNDFAHKLGHYEVTQERARKLEQLVKQYGSEIGRDRRAADRANGRPRPLCGRSSAGFRRRDSPEFASSTCSR